MDPISSTYENQVHHSITFSKNQDSSSSRIESFSLPKTLPVLATRDRQHVASMNKATSHFLMQSALRENSESEDVETVSNIPADLEKELIRLFARGIINCLQIR